MLRLAVAVLLCYCSTCLGLVRQVRKEPAAPSSLFPIAAVPAGYGYPVTFDNLPTADTRFEHFLEKGRAWPQADGRPGARVIFYDVDVKRGIDDRMYEIVRWLSFATAANAALAFPSPKEVLTRGHGRTTAEWWTDYYITEPPMYQRNEAVCDPKAEEVNVTFFGDWRHWPERALAALRDQSQPLCIRLQEGEGHTDDVDDAVANQMQSGASQVGIWTSAHVAELVEDVLHRNPGLFGNHYNAMHVRLGDKLEKGGTLCSNISFVMDVMGHVTQNYSSYGNNPWMLMSDGTPDFFRDMKTAASEQGFNIVSEHELRGVTSIKDNYMRYTVLSCLWAESDLGIVTYKRIGKKCIKNPDRQQVASFFLPCFDKSEEDL